MRLVRGTARRYPLAAALILVGLYFAVFFVPPLFSPQSFGRGKVIEGAGDLTALLPLEAALALSVLGAVGFYGWWRECRFSTPLLPGGLKFLAFPYLFAGLLLVAVTLALRSEGGEALRDAVSPSLVGNLVAVTVLIGIFEETLFRGILFHGIEAGRGRVAALVGSSVAFGLMHYVNWVGGQPFMVTSGQVAHAVAAGFMYAALMLRIGSIWPVILFHGFWDATVALIGTLGTKLPEAGDASQASAVLVVLGLAGFETGYGLLVLRSARRRRPPLPA
ncbi:MAG: CPBP family intramembrane metalloprotease [Oricola sp.]